MDIISYVQFSAGFPFQLLETPAGDTEFPRAIDVGHFEAPQLEKKENTGVLAARRGSSSDVEAKCPECIAGSASPRMHCRTYSKTFEHSRFLNCEPEISQTRVRISRRTQFISANVGNPIEPDRITSCLVDGSVNLLKQLARSEDMIARCPSGYQLHGRSIPSSYL